MAGIPSGWSKIHPEAQQKLALECSPERCRFSSGQAQASQHELWVQSPSPHPTAVQLNGWVIRL